MGRGRTRKDAENGEESLERPACAEAAQASSRPRMARLIWNSGTQEEGTATELTAKVAKNVKS